MSTPPCYRGATALHAVAHNGRKEVVELLLENRADVNVTDNDGLGLGMSSLQL